MESLTLVPFLHSQLKSSVCCQHVSGCHCVQDECAHRIALVTVAGNLSLATAEFDASVLVGIAPRLLVVQGHRARVDTAARDGGIVIARGVLRRGKAGESRGGDEDGRVEHCCGWGQRISMPTRSRVSGRSAVVVEKASDRAWDER